MATATLVENQIEDGRAFLERLQDEHFPVVAAGWVKPAEIDRWSLTIVTPMVDDKGSTAAYGEAFRVLRSMGPSWVTSSEVKLVGENHPTAQDLLEVVRQSRGRSPAWSPWPTLSGRLGEVFLYSFAGPKVTIYGLVYDGAPEQPLHLSFEPHSPISKLTVEGPAGHRDYDARTGIDWVVKVPEGAKLERNQFGQMVLAWDFRGQRVQSNAQVVWSLANLKLHGFRFVHQPA